MHHRPHRLALAGLLGAGAVALTAGPAAAHVTADEDEVPAGAFTEVEFTVPHGCDGSPTTAIAISIPESVPNVTPAIVPGWDVAIETEALDEPIEGSHGEQITERESVVTYTAQPGNELPDGFRTSFELGFQAPDAAGETLLFPIVQTCVEGETAWIDPDPEAETPAPQVAIVAAEGDEHGHDDGEDDDHGDDDSSSDGLAVGGLVLGALGLATGGAALAKSRKTA